MTIYWKWVVRLVRTVRTIEDRSKVKLGWYLKENEWMSEYNGMYISEPLPFGSHRLGQEESWLSVSSEMNKVQCSNPMVTPPWSRFLLENCRLKISTQQQQATVTPAVIGWHFKNALRDYNIFISRSKSKKSLRLSINYWILKVLLATGVISY